MQLSVLGYILVPIFALGRWWLTLLYCLFMLAVASAEAVSRPSQVGRQGGARPLMRRFFLPPVLPCLSMLAGWPRPRRSPAPPRRAALLAALRLGPPPFAASPVARTRTPPTPHGTPLPTCRPHTRLAPCARRTMVACSPMRWGPWVWPVAR